MSRKVKSQAYFSSEHLSKFSGSLPKAYWKIPRSLYMPFVTSRRLPEGSLEISRRCPEGSGKVPRKFPVSFLEFLQADVRADVVAKLAADPPQNSQMPSDASGGYIRSMYAASTRQVRSECAAGQRVRGRYAAGTRKYPAHMLLLLLFMFRIVPEIS